jgi:hypothetical protein
MSLVRRPTAKVAQVASSDSNVTLLAANPSRQGFIIYNDSTAVLYIKFGATAATSSYTIKCPAGATFAIGALAASTGPVVYTGIVDGIWAAANGVAAVTEL